MTDGYLTTGQVARQLKLSPERVRQLARSGELPSVDTELGRLFDPDVVRTYADARVRYLRPRTPPEAASRAAP